MTNRRSKKITFEGSDGTELHGRLDLPAGKPRGMALFAHCFTCSKDLFSVTQISKALNAKGFGVLRFDFTGLGHSEGEFENTDFSSNIEDIVSASRHLEEQVRAPEILMGHSLGGTAVIGASRYIESAKAVVTIGSPFDPEHVEGLLDGKLDEIEGTGEASVTIAGRSFQVKRQFLDDIRQHSIEDELKNLKRPLLIFHSPVDEIVGIENARRIYQAAKHPKSFISLDRADHLLTNKKDAAYVGSTLAAWVERYLEPDEPEQNRDQGPESIVVSESGDGKFQNDVVMGSHYLVADEPRKYGGDDAGPSPYDLLLASLGSCTSMTLRMYADRKDWPLESVSVRLSHEKIHAEDCEGCEQESGKVDEIERIVDVAGDLSDDQRSRLVEIAGKCPVHRTLHRRNKIETKLASSLEDD